MSRRNNEIILFINYRDKIFRSSSASVIKAVLSFEKGEFC